MSTEYMSIKAFEALVKRYIKEAIHDEMLQEFGDSSSDSTNPGDTMLVSGTKMTINQGIEAASKEQDFKKKAELLSKIATQMQTTKF